MPESIACKLSKSGEQREKRRSGESEELKREKKVMREGLNITFVVKVVMNKP